LASVGSLNLDNRSMRINFELTAVVAEAGFIAAVVRMLEGDFGRCKELSATSLKRMKLGTRVAVRLARLMAPVL
jgi:cardiolipin synthase